MMVVVAGIFQLTGALASLSCLEMLNPLTTDRSQWYASPVCALQCAEHQKKSKNNFDDLIKHQTDL